MQNYFNFKLKFMASKNKIDNFYLKLIKKVHK